MRSSGRRVSPRGEVTHRRKSYGGSELDTAAQADLNTMRPVRKVVQLVVVRAAGSTAACAVAADCIGGRCRSGFFRKASLMSCA